MHHVDSAPGFDYGVTENTIVHVIRSVRTRGVVLDVGCAGWRIPTIAHEVGRTDLKHIGADLNNEPANKPSGVEFIAIARDGEPFGSGLADLVISSHCLEHSRCPVEQFRSLIVSCRPGGLVYVETPSELSAAIRSEDDPRSQAFGSFWDDPTHVRPYTPGALYRLGLSFRVHALQCGRLERGGIPCAAAVFRKDGDYEYRYVSLRDVPPGSDAAMAAIWSEPNIAG